MRYESENVYTKRKDNGMYGLFSRVTFLEGSEVLDLRSGDKVEERDFRSIELDDGHYLHPDGMFTNHSCNPTAFVSKWSGMLMAARDIFPGDEITFNYLESETEIAGTFDCNCGADNCVGRVGNIS